MRIGDLRKRVTIQQRNVTRDAYGASIETWDPLVTVWANIEALRGREYFNAAQVRAEVTHRIRIRYLPNITPAMRVVEGNRTFDIQAVLEDNKKRELMLIVKEVV